jgi:hypothetical protein
MYWHVLLGRPHRELEVDRHDPEILHREIGRALQHDRRFSSLTCCSACSIR